MKIGFEAIDTTKIGALAVFADKDKALSTTPALIDAELDGAIGRAIICSRFRGERGEILEILAPSDNHSRILLVGIGAGDDFSERKAEELGGALVARLISSGENILNIALDKASGEGLDTAHIAARIAAGARMRAYRFDKYRTKEPDHKKPSLKAINLLCSDHAKAAELYAPMDAVIDGVYFTRDLISEPGNIIHPESYAQAIKSLSEDGVDVQLLGEAELEKIGMRALLAVGQGSDKESHVAIMRWNGLDDADAQPVCLVGKGVTFDTGGISLKPGEGMDEMKWDMGGSGIVVGTMRALARRKAKVNVVAIVGLVENMPSGNAQRPGDVVTSMSGQTIEVLNTDAEGRLVLADILWYAKENFKPKAMIDLATLTGAMIIALGTDQYAGYFASDEALAKQLYDAGERSGDLAWRMPLSDEYDRLIDSPIADMKNIGGRGAGSITAAQFLKRYTGDVPWAHIDVAGVVWSKKDTNIWEKGATGYGVRLLDRWIADNHE